MKKVFTATKSSYGSEFTRECTTLEALKRSIVSHEYAYEELDGKEYTADMYTEELFQQVVCDYQLYEIDLHDDEIIEFHGYDGTSWFSIEKKDPNILSTLTRITL